MKRVKLTTAAMIISTIILTHAHGMQTPAINPDLAGLEQQLTTLLPKENMNPSMLNRLWRFLNWLAGSYGESGSVERIMNIVNKQINDDNSMQLKLQSLFERAQKSSGAFKTPEAAQKILGEYQKQIDLYALDKTKHKILECLTAYKANTDLLDKVVSIHKSSLNSISTKGITEFTQDDKDIAHLFVGASSLPNRKLDSCLSENPAAKALFERVLEKDIKIDIKQDFANQIREKLNSERGVPTSKPCPDVKPAINIQEQVTAKLEEAKEFFQKNYSRTFQPAQDKAKELYNDLMGKYNSADATTQYAVQTTLIALGVFITGYAVYKTYKWFTKPAVPSMRFYYGPQPSRLGTTIKNFVCYGLPSALVGAGAAAYALA